MELTKILLKDFLQWFDGGVPEILKDHDEIISDYFAESKGEIEIKLVRMNGKWCIRIGNGAFPELFDSFDDAIVELRKSLNI